MTNPLTVAQVAERLGLSRQRIHALIRTGRLPAVRVGCYWLVEEAALAAVQHRPNGYPKGRPRQGP